MNRIVRALPLLLFLSGCATAADVVQPVMVISPTTIVFSPPSSDTTVSITHTCSCPFNWTATVIYNGPMKDSSEKHPWLVLGTNFPASLSNDKPNVGLSIDRVMLSKDSTLPPMTPYSAVIAVVSNSYGVDSIHVTAIK